MIQGFLNSMSGFMPDTADGETEEAEDAAGDDGESTE